MQSSLQKLLSWVWQIVLSWLGSIKSRLNHHLCLERPADMVMIATEMAVENNAKELGEDSRDEKASEAVLFIEEDIGGGQITSESVTENGEEKVVEVYQMIHEVREERNQPPEHEVVSSSDQNPSISDAANSADHNPSTSAEVVHSPPVSKAIPVIGGGVEVAEEFKDLLVNDNSAIENETSNENNDDTDYNIFPFEDLSFEDLAVPNSLNEVNDLAESPVAQDKNNQDNPVKEEDNDQENHVNEDDDDDDDDDDEENHVNEEVPKDEKEEVDNSVTWLMNIGSNHESYVNLLSPQYYCLDFRSNIAIDNEKITKALKQLRSLLPWLGLGLKRRKEDMWLCVFPEEDKNFRMSYNSNIWEEIANNHNNFTYVENILLHSFTLMKASPCTQCKAFVDGNVCTDNPNRQVEISSEGSSGQGPSCEILSSSEVDKIDDACRDICAMTGEIKDKATGCDCKCPSLISASNCSVDIENTIDEPPSADRNLLSTDKGDCASDTASLGNTFKKTTVANKVNEKTFPHNYRFVFSVPKPLADEKSVDAICDGFLHELNNVLSELANSGHKDLISSNAVDVGEEDGEKEGDERTPKIELETVDQIEGSSQSVDKDSCVTSKSSEKDFLSAFMKADFRLDLVSDKYLSVLQKFSVLTDVLGSIKKSESDSKSQGSLPSNNVHKVDRNSPNINREVEVSISKNFVNKCKSERVSFISAFATCINSVIGKTLVESGLWKENDDLDIGHSISHYHNLDDLTDQEWHDYSDEDNENDDEEDYDNDSLCCREPTVSLKRTLRHELREVWETTRIIDKKRKEIQKSSRNTRSQVIPHNTENLTVDNTRFPSILQPESNFSVTNIIHMPPKLNRQLQCMELLSFHSLPPVVIFLMTIRISLYLRNGILSFNIYNQHQFVPNSVAQDFGDKIESSLVECVKVS